MNLLGLLLGVWVTEYGGISEGSTQGLVTAPGTCRQLQDRISPQALLRGLHNVKEGLTRLVTFLCYV